MARKSQHRESWDESGAAYNSKHDGPLESYLETHDGYSAFPLFKGSEHFELLKSHDLLIPRRSMIRLMWNVGREDEHFEVTEDFQLEGLTTVAAHAGREGVFSAQSILDAKGAPCWEAQRLRRVAREKFLREQALKNSTDDLKD